MNQKINVGFIGLHPDRQWASRSHLPALQLLQDDFTIMGVANGTHESARATASALQIPHAFQDARALIQSPAIDLVVITVKVPAHYDLVMAALEAGKHVYCEHPLAPGLEETRQLAARAERAGVVAVVGTQMVVAPEVLYLRQLIDDGFVGDVLSTTLIGSGGQWRDQTQASLYYMYEKASGANLLTIPLGHTLAGLTTVLGGFDRITARMVQNYPVVKLTDTGEIKPKTVADQIMVMGTLHRGSAFSIHYRGGISRGTNLLWEINGSEGDIQVTGAIGHAQLTPLTLKGARGDGQELTVLLPPDDDHANVPDNPMVRNVAKIYTLLAGDIRNNTRTAPSFQDALRLHEVLHTIEQSAQNY